MRGVWAYNQDGRPQYFSISGAQGQVHTQWMQADGNWSGWRRVGGATAHPVFVSIAPCRHRDGRIELAARTQDDRTFRLHQQSANGQWADRWVQW